MNKTQAGPQLFHSLCSKMKTHYLFKESKIKILPFYHRFCAKCLKYITSFNPPICDVLGMTVPNLQVRKLRQEDLNNLSRVIQLRVTGMKLKLLQPPVI
jgi:hypothetical protein